MAKYKYIDNQGRFLAESDSPIKFSDKMMPTWNDIEPVIEEKSKSKRKSALNNNMEDSDELHV